MSNVRPAADITKDQAAKRRMLASIKANRVRTQVVVDRAAARMAEYDRQEAALRAELSGDDA